MNFAKILKSMLLERDDVKRSYGCVMGELTIPDKTWEDIQSKIEDDEVYNKDDKFGREDNPHVTLLYGIHDDVPDEDVEEVVDTFNVMEITLKEVDIFEQDDYDVVKFNISHDGLKECNKKLKELPYTNDYPEYKAHVTIAYVEAGKGQEIADRYKDISSMDMMINEIRYSKPDKSNEYYKLKE